MSGDTFRIYGGVQDLESQVEGLRTRVDDLREERDIARAERNALIRHMRAAHDDSWRPGPVEVRYERAHLHLTETMDPIREG